MKECAPLKIIFVPIKDYVPHYVFRNQFLPFDINIELNYWNVPNNRQIPGTDTEVSILWHETV